MIRLAILIHRIGPYHHARFLALSKHCELYVLEIKPHSDEYAWEQNYNSDSYTVVRLNETVSAKYQIEKYLSLWEPVSVTTTGFADKEYWIAFRWAKNNMVPIATFSDSRKTDKDRNYLQEYFKRSIVKGFDGAIVAGQQALDYIKTLGIHNCVYKYWDVVDNDYFNNKRYSQELLASIKDKYCITEEYFLCISRFVEKKNHKRLLQAFAQYVLNGGATKQLYLIGGGELRQLLEHSVIEYGLQYNVKIFDFVQYDELPLLYKESKAIILASLYDQWGLVVNEAMACSKPVLLSNNCGAVSDLLVEGENGFSFDPFEVTSIVDAMKSIDSIDCDHILKMGENSKLLINNWTIDHFVNSVLSFVDNSVCKKVSMLQKILIALYVR